MGKTGRNGIGRNGDGKGIGIGTGSSGGIGNTGPMKSGVGAESGPASEYNRIKVLVLGGRDTNHVTGVCHAVLPSGNRI